MFAKCSNPACAVPFDYREGRLIRFCKAPLDGQSLASQYCVEHFWLCRSCSELYVFEYEREAGMRIKLRVRQLRERAAPSFVTDA
jgi:hypothetical protein